VQETIRVFLSSSVWHVILVGVAIGMITIGAMLLAIYWVRRGHNREH
jgi:hypothetical protein